MHISWTISTLQLAFYSSTVVALCYIRISYFVYCLCFHFSLVHFPYDSLSPFLSVTFLPRFIMKFLRPRLYSRIKHLLVRNYPKVIGISRQLHTRRQNITYLNISTQQQDLSREHSVLLFEFEQLPVMIYLRWSFKTIISPADWRDAAFPMDGEVVCESHRTKSGGLQEPEPTSWPREHL